MKTINQCFDWTDLTDLRTEADPRPKKLTDLPGKDVYLVIHHAYNRKVQDTIALSKPGGRQVSMTMALGPTVAGSTAVKGVQVVPWNTHRPFTTSSWIDNQAITVETSNLLLEPPYPVAQTAKYRLAELAAAMHVELGMPLDRWHVCSHQEVYARGWGSYATACPGGDLQAALDWIVATAKAIVAASAAGGKVKVTTYYYPDRSKKVLKPGTIDFQRKKDNSADQNIVGGVGPYSITCEVYATGTPGDVLEILLMIQDQKKPSSDASRNSDWYTHQATIDPNGELQVSVPFNLPQSKIEGGKMAVFSEVRTPKTNKGNVTVTVQDSVAFLFTGA